MSSDTEDDLNTDKEDDLSGETEDDSDADNEDAFDPSLDFSKIDDNAFDPSLDFSKIDDNAFDPSLDFSKIDENAFDPSLDFSKIDDNDFDPSLDFNENEGKLGQNERGKELEPNQTVPNESNTEVSSENSGLKESESNEEKEEFNPNNRDGEIDNFEEEGYSEGFYGNFNAESMNTVLLSENLIYAALKEYIEFMVENEAETEVQGELSEVDNSKEEISELEEFLQGERERNRLEQQQAEFEEGIESEPNANEEEIEDVVDQEQEIGIQENISEEMVPNNEEEVENVEMKLEEELQSTLPNENIESDKGEEIEEKNEEPQPHGIEENIEGREKDFKVDDGKYEQDQCENQIEEKLNNESEPIAHEKELELIKEEQEEKEDHDEFTKEGALGQINQELEVIREMNSNETEVLANDQEEELQQDHISPYREKLRAIEEYKDSQQELEEVLEQTRKIEHETLIEVEQEQEKSDKTIEENYEKAKILYNQETGRRSIYANNETEGFKQWLEQKKESEEKQEHLQIQEENSEVLKKEIEQESDEGINPKLGLLLKEIIENYNFLENLTTRFKELYESAQNKQISKTEKNELKLLINSLKKVGPTKFMLFASIKAIKSYTNKEKFSDKANLNHTLNFFSTKFLQKNLLFKTLLENQKVKPITHEEKGLSTKAWGALRKLVWTETNKYIKGKINILKELTVEKYGLLTKHVLNKISNTLQLSKQKLSKERIGLLKKAIIAIYLLNLDNPPSQAEIRRVSGFTGNYQVKDIRDHVQINLPASIRNRSLYDNSKTQIMECSNCHEIKSYTHFTRRKSSGKLRTDCNQCRSIRNSIIQYQKKILAAIYISLKNKEGMTAKTFLKALEDKKKFDVQISCSECGVGLKALPAIEVHHLNPETKIAGFSDTLKHISIKKMIEILEKDNVSVLCSNCHAIEGATFFTKYLKIILSEEYHHYPNITKKRIRGFIKKKKIVNELYNGVCSICKKVGVKSLPSLSFHHLEPENKTIEKPSDFIKSHGDLTEIKQKFKDEKLSLLCRNCHSSLECKRFSDNYQEITKRYLEDFK